MHACNLVAHAATNTCAVTFADAGTTNTSTVSGADTAPNASPYVATDAFAYAFANGDANTSTPHSSYSAFGRSGRAADAADAAAAFTSANAVADTYIMSLL